MYIQPAISNVPILSKKQQHITVISWDKSIEPGWLLDAGGDSDSNVMLLSVWRRGAGSVFVFFSNKSWQSLSEDCNVLSEKWKKCSDKLFLFSIHLISLFSQIFISCASRAPDLSYYLSETEMNQETIFTFLSICFSFKLSPVSCLHQLPAGQFIWLSWLTRGRAGDSEVIR